jgi:hypothetical protein
MNLTAFYECNRYVQCTLYICMSLNGKPYSIFILYYSNSFFYNSSNVGNAFRYSDERSFFAVGFEKEDNFSDALCTYECMNNITF